MAIDVAYVVSYLIYCIITAIVLFFSLSIYLNTKGASLAYKMWAIGTCLLFIGCFVYLVGGLLFEASNTDSSDKNELIAILGESIVGFGYFYLPVGVMYLSKDMEITDIDKKLIKKVQIIFFSLIGFTTISFLALFSFYKMLTIIGIVFNFLYVLIWLVTLYPYRAVYQTLKSMNSCWLLIYIGIITGLISEILSVFMYVIPVLEYIMILFQLIMALSLVLAFFKLAKMLEAV